MSLADLASRRELLLSVRLRFSPELRSVRESAIDAIVEQQLLLLDRVDGVSARDIEESCAIGNSDHPILLRQDIDRSIKALTRSGRITKLGGFDPWRYRLSPEVLAEHERVDEQSRAGLERIVKRLFPDPAGSDQFIDPFLRTLSSVFAALGEGSVRLIRGDISGADLVRLPVLHDSLDPVLASLEPADRQTFGDGVVSFFTTADTHYDELKWNLAQNHYLAKALGLDPSGSLLSTELFAGARFYLDTNTLIHALQPETRHHLSFAALSEACRRIGTELVVCQISLDELRQGAASNVAEDPK